MALQISGTMKMNHENKKNCTLANSKKGSNFENLVIKFFNQAMSSELSRRRSGGPELNNSVLGPPKPILRIP